MSINDTNQTEPFAALEFAAPPPSRALVDAVRSMGPVSPRRPRLTLAIAGGISLVYAAIIVGLVPLRGDLPDLPAGWWWAVAPLWLCGFAVPLWLALVPKSGSVLPEVERAGRAAAGAALALILIGLLLTPDARSPLSRTDGAAAAGALLHCLRISLEVAVVPLLFGFGALRRVVLCGAWRVGAAVGAAGGALGGLVLHAICPVGGGLHVGLAHGGGVLLGAAVGAGLFGLLRSMIERRP